jgi:hypothetical protein
MSCGRRRLQYVGARRVAWPSPGLPIDEWPKSDPANNGTRDRAHRNPTRRRDPARGPRIRIRGCRRALGSRGKRPDVHSDLVLRRCFPRSMRQESGTYFLAAVHPLSRNWQHWVAVTWGSANPSSGLAVQPVGPATAAGCRSQTGDHASPRPGAVLRRRHPVSQQRADRSAQPASIRPERRSPPSGPAASNPRCPSADTISFGDGPIAKWRYRREKGSLSVSH